MTLLYTICISLLAAVALTVRVFYYRLGKNSQKLKEAEQAIDAVKKSKNAISNLDDAKRKRLREKYKY